MNDMKLVCAIFGSNNKANKYNKGLINLLKRASADLPSARVIVGYDRSSERFVDGLRHDHRYAGKVIFCDMRHLFPNCELTGESRTLWRLYLSCMAVDGIGVYIPVDVDATDYKMCKSWIEQLSRRDCDGIDCFIHKKLLSQTREYVDGLPVLCDFCESCFVVRTTRLWRFAFESLIKRHGPYMHSRIVLAAHLMDCDLCDVLDLVPTRCEGYGVDEMLLTILEEDLRTTMTCVDLSHVTSARISAGGGGALCRTRTTSTVLVFSSCKSHPQE